MIPFLVVMMFFSGSCKKNDEITNDFSSLNYKLDDTISANIKVCVYMDYGLFDTSGTSIKNMLNGIHCTYTAVNRDSILHDALSHYNLLLMPGGDMWQFKSHLSTTGMAKIKEYVRHGGGYIGICGGAYFAASLIVWRGWAGQPRDSISISGLSLSSVIADGPIENFAPSYVVSDCKINIVQPAHPIAADLPDVIAPYYDHGPMFLFTDSIHNIVLGKTVTGDKKVIIAFQCDSGKVFLTGTHPEADNSRAEWVMVKNAVKWCSKL